MVLLLLYAPFCEAQKKKSFGRNRQSKFQERFLQKQVWVGIKAGGNVTKAVPVHRYSAFSSTTGQDGMFDKKYHDFSSKAGQAGLEVTFFYKMFSLSFQPGYRRMVFGYANEYSWSDPSNGSNTMQQKYEALQKLDYFEFPLFLRFEPLHTRLRPYVQAGWYYSRLNNAFKETTITVRDMASGGSNEYVAQQISADAKDLFIRSNMGWAVGAGVSFPVGNARIGADFSYFRNIHNITSVQNRYSNDRLTGAGDILDDVKLRNLSLSLTLLMPLRFVILKENYKVQ